MPSWLKDVAPIVAALSIVVNIFLFHAKRKLELEDIKNKQERELKDRNEMLVHAARIDREKVSRGIAAKLAEVFNPYTAETTKSLENVQTLRMNWGSEGMLVDLVHDEGTGRKLTLLVTNYLDAVASHVQGSISAADLHTRRSEVWRQAREVLESFVEHGRKGS